MWGEGEDEDGTLSREGQHLIVAQSLPLEEQAHLARKTLGVCAGVPTRVTKILQTGDLICGDSWLPPQSPPGLRQRPWKTQRNSQEKASLLCRKSRVGVGTIQAKDCPFA